MPLSWLWAASRPEDRIPRHEITVSEIVALEFFRKSMLKTQQCSGYELKAPATYEQGSTDQNFPP